MRESIRNIQSHEELRESYDRLYSQKESFLTCPLKHYQLMLEMLEPERGKKLLDVACGPGYLLKEAESRGLMTSGIDISPKAIEMAKEYCLKSELKVGSGENLPWPDNFFDYLTCLGSLEHFLNPAKGVQEMNRVLKEDGKALILLPNSYYLGDVWVAFRTGDVWHDKQEIGRRATKKEWHCLLETNGLKVTRIRKYNPFPDKRWAWKQRLFNLFTPLNLCYHFIFICGKSA